MPKWIVVMLVIAVALARIDWLRQEWRKIRGKRDRNQH
jgi:hypothetical protein